MREKAGVRRAPDEGMGKKTRFSLPSTRDRIGAPSNTVPQNGTAFNLIGITVTRNYGDTPVNTRLSSPPRALDAALGGVLNQIT
jgi:hypothetical protein